MSSEQTAGAGNGIATGGRSLALKRIKTVLWALAIAGLVVGIGRFAFGLGASTRMMDTLPWGLWKIFNMVAGAALATSGFVVACILYILRLERYRSVARLSVLVGFLGYGASLFALVFDIGLPHRGWHPLFMWNPHSFLFEVFWCVSCYWAITALELIPIVSERLPLKKFTHFMHEVMLPFVVLGITLSTMHHSSLGSLFLASPTRLHPLWHSLWIPPEFFASAMGAGVFVIVLLSLSCGWLFNRKPDMAVLTRLSKIAAVILCTYLIIKAADFTLNHKWCYVFGPDLTWESRLFWVEILLQAVVPVLIIAFPGLRNRAWGLVLAASSAFLGLVLHRLNTGIVGYFTSAGAVYIPNLSEFILSFGILAAAGLLFFFLVERFYVLREPGGHGEGVKVFSRKELLSILKSPETLKVGFLSVIIVPAVVLGLKGQATGPYQPEAQPVHAPRAKDVMRTRLRIDGNRNNDFVLFPHVKHHEELGEEASCIKCHHLNLPEDHNTACWRCHRDMGISTNYFDHEAHQARHGGEASCGECHDPNLPEGRETAKACLACHRENMIGLSDYEKKGFNHMALGYRYAMHGLCLTCHRLKGKDPADPLDMGNCRKCHPLNGATGAETPSDGEKAP